MSRLGLLLLAVATGAFAQHRRSADRPPATPFASDSLSISGVVMDEESRLPIAGAIVILESSPEHQTQTNAKGEYRFESLGYRTHFVRARSLGRIEERRAVEPMCTIVLSGPDGNVIRPSYCTTAKERLNFYMRPKVFLES